MGGVGGGFGVLGVGFLGGGGEVKFGRKRDQGHKSPLQRIIDYSREFWEGKKGNGPWVYFSLLQGEIKVTAEGNETTNQCCLSDKNGRFC